MHFLALLCHWEGKIQEAPPSLSSITAKLNKLHLTLVLRIGPALKGEQGASHPTLPVPNNTTLDWHIYILSIDQHTSKRGKGIYQAKHPTHEGRWPHLLLMDQTALSILLDQNLLKFCVKEIFTFYWHLPQSNNLGNVRNESKVSMSWLDMVHKVPEWVDCVLQTFSRILIFHYFFLSNIDTAEKSDWINISIMPFKRPELLPSVTTGLLTTPQLTETKEIFPSAWPS